MFNLQTTGPVPDDLGTRKVFEKVRVPLPHLAEALIVSGQALVGRRFIDCVIHGPSIVVPTGATRFENCNLGNAAGDIRNLFLQAAGPMIIGGFPLNDAVFEGCVFIDVGFAGDALFVNSFVDKLSPKKA